MNATVQIRDISRGPVKRINGGCLAPPLNAENAGLNLRKQFADLHLPITRLHDAPLENRGLSLVDVPMIFPLFHADANDPRNYNFRATDDYIQNCIDCGTKIYYRLGVSIDHSLNKYVIEPPPDTGKWIEIVSHIIDHYNNGWADGFHHGIEYWEIWNEPEGISGKADGIAPLHTMWNAPVESYYAFYVEVAAALKKRYPALKIGGPSNCSWGLRDNRFYAKEFLQYVHDAGAPLDFYSYHIYANSMDWVSRQLGEIRSTLDSLGFGGTEIHITEWAYCPRNGFKRLRANNGRDAAQVFAEKAGIHAGAFLAYALTVWQDLPVDMAHFYTVTATKWGLFDFNSHQPNKEYYGLKAFGDLAFFYPERIDARITEFAGEPLPHESPDKEFGFEALAGRDAGGNIAILATNYRYGRSRVAFDCRSMGGFRRAELLLVDDRCDLETVAVLEPVEGVLEFHSPSDSAVYFLQLRR